MKIIFTSAVSLLISGMVFSQASIKLTDGQKIVIESSSDIQASLAMGMELTSTTASVNSLQVKNMAGNNYNIGSTLTKMKVNMNMMGQSNNYNSDNKDGNDENMAKLFDEKMNKQIDISIDSKTGAVVAQKKKAKKTDDDADADPTAGLMKMFADNSDEGIVSGAFVVLPQGKKVGDSWADTTSDNDIKTISTFTFKSVTGNEGLILTNIISTGKTKMNFQEMEFEVKTETKTNGEIVADISTGQVKKRTNVADITGSIQMMGQDMPISAKATTTSKYN